VIQGDFADDYDPYRSTIGMSQALLVLTILGVDFGIRFGAMLLLYLVVRH
jgi:hypothetical protein